MGVSCLRVKGAPGSTGAAPRGPVPFPAGMCRAAQCVWVPWPVLHARVGAEAVRMHRLLHGCKSPPGTAQGSPRGSGLFLLCTGALAQACGSHQPMPTAVLGWWLQRGDPVPYRCHPGSESLLSCPRTVVWQLSCLCTACTGFQPGKDRNLEFLLGHSGCPGRAAHSPTSSMPSCCPAQRCPSCSSSCPWGCPGLILHLWDARSEEKMGSADLTGPEYQLWRLLRDEVHTAWGSPGCCIGVPIGVPGHCAFSSASLQHG